MWNQLQSGTPLLSLAVNETYVQRAQAAHFVTQAPQFAKRHEPFCAPCSQWAPSP